jgi:hypothetical protein
MEGSPFACFTYYGIREDKDYALRRAVLGMEDGKIQKHDPRLGDHEAELRAVDDAVDKFLIELNKRGWDLQRLITHWHDLRRNGHVEVDDG